MGTKEEKSEHLLHHHTGTNGEKGISGKGGVEVGRWALTKISSTMLEIQGFQKWAGDRKSPAGQQATKIRSVMPPDKEGRKPINWKRAFSFRLTWRAGQKQGT